MYEAFTIESQRTLASCRALVVDDSDAVAELVKDVFDEEGASVVRAPDAEAALERLDGDADFDVLVVDLGLPGLGGEELLNWIDANRPDLLGATFVLTGRCYDRAALERIGRMGVRVLFKPFSLDELRSVAAEAAGRLHPPQGAAGSSA